MRFLSSASSSSSSASSPSRTSASPNKKLRKESAPTPSPTAAVPLPKSHSKSVDHGLTLSCASPPLRSPPPVPVIELAGDDMRWVDATSSTVAPSRPQTSASQRPTMDRTGSWRGSSEAAAAAAAAVGRSSTEIPTQLDRRSRRPNIQVFIPRSHPPSSHAYNPQRSCSERHDDKSELAMCASSWSRPRTSSSTDGSSSPLVRSTLSPPRPGTPAGAGPGLRGLGLERRTESPAPMTASMSAASVSTDETVDEDRSSIESRRTSVSSVAADGPGAATTKPRPIPSPSASAVSLDAPSAVDRARRSRSPTPLRTRISIKDLANKPLPPEPMGIAPAPLMLSATRSPVLLPTSRPLPSPSPSSLKSPGTPVSASSLKSKYSSSDLDSIDQAFRRSSPKHEPASLQQAEQALEAHLSKMNEPDVFRWDDLPGMSGPLQISRGPMRMNPSRPPPPTPKIHVVEPTRSQQQGRKNAKSPGSADSADSPLPSPVREKKQRRRPPPPPPPQQQQQQQQQKRSSIVDSGRKWTTRALRRRAQDKTRLSTIPDDSAASSQTSLLLPIRSSVDRPSTPASIRTNYSASESVTHLGMEEALKDYASSDRSIYAHSPYASSTALPLSPGSTSPRGTQFPVRSSLNDAFEVPERQSRKDSHVSLDRNPDEAVHGNKSNVESGGYGKADGDADSKGNKDSSSSSSANSKVDSSVVTEVNSTDNSTDDSNVDSNVNGTDDKKNARSSVDSNGVNNVNGIDSSNAESNFDSTDNGNARSNVDGNSVIDVNSTDNSTDDSNASNVDRIYNGNGGDDCGGSGSGSGSGSVGVQTHFERRGRRSSAVTSIISLAVSDIPDWYLNMPSSEEYAAQRRRAAVAQAVERNINAKAAETIILKILQGLESLQDLFSAAVVSRGFYRTFKKHELPLMKKALKSMSAPAWELREVSAPDLSGDDHNFGRSGPASAPAAYLRDYTRDMYTMVALKSLILARCRGFLRPETILALAGEDDEQRALELDDAFWRVWTFCKMFGDSTCRTDDRDAQMNWLRGGRDAEEADDATPASMQGPFGRGNGDGLSADNLWDMLEIWTCLGVLVRGFHGRTQLARQYGIYDGVDVADDDEEASVLGEFSHFP